MNLEKIIFRGYTTFVSVYLLSAAAIVGFGVRSCIKEMDVAAEQYKYVKKSCVSSFIIKDVNKDSEMDVVFYLDNGDSLIYVNNGNGRYSLENKNCLKSGVLEQKFIECLDALVFEENNKQR